MNREAWMARWKRLPHPLRWVVVGLLGGSLVIVGLVFMVLPGPGIPLVILGLVILATEFAWAEALLHRTKQGVKSATALVRKKK